jgi:hypothetical protein
MKLDYKTLTGHCREREGEIKIAFQTLGGWRGGYRGVIHNASCRALNLIERNTHNQFTNTHLTV